MTEERENKSSGLSGYGLMVSPEKVHDGRRKSYGMPVVGSRFITKEMNICTPIESSATQRRLCLCDLSEFGPFLPV